MVAQHFTQGFVHQVCGRVIAHSSCTQVGVDLRLNGITHFQAAFKQHAVMTKHIGFDFQSVFYFKFGTSRLQQTLITHLTARLCVKRCGVQNHHTALTCFEF